MAAGDFTIDATSHGSAGNHKRISGTAEVDGDARTFDIFPSGYVHDFHIHGYDDAGQVEVRSNEDADGTANNGAVALQSGTRSVNTYNWTALYT